MSLPGVHGDHCNDLGRAFVSMTPAENNANNLHNPNNSNVDYTSYNDERGKNGGATANNGEDRAQTRHDHPAAATSSGPSGPGPNLTAGSSAVNNDKRFATAYGTVMWPTLPGVTASSETLAPAAEPPSSAEMLPASVRSALAAATRPQEGGEGGEAGVLDLAARPIRSDAWSVKPSPLLKGEARGNMAGRPGVVGGAKRRGVPKPNVGAESPRFLSRGNA